MLGRGNIFLVVRAKSKMWKKGCYGFVWQGFCSGGAIGVNSVRSCEKLPPCLIKPVPAGSKTELLLAKAKPISENGNTSVITDVRRGRIKNCSEKAVEREE